MDDAEFPSKLKPLFQAMRFKVMHGGRGGAKSWSIARALLLKGRSRPIRVLCCREFQKSIKDSVLTLLNDQINQMGMDDFYTVLHNEIRGQNETQFNFEGLSQNVQGIKSYEGVDYAWVEEGNAVTKKSWEILIPTIRKPGSEIWVSFNPEFEDDYAYERWVVGNDDRAWVCEINWPDNPWFPEVLNEERLAHKERDPETYDHVWEGKPRKWLEGAIYAKQLRLAYEEERITKVEHDPSLPVFTAWDIGRTDDLVIWWYQVSGPELHLLECWGETGTDPSICASQVLGKHIQINLIDGEIRITGKKDGEDVPVGEAEDYPGAEHRKRYKYQTHWLPGDGKQKRWEAQGKSAIEQMRKALGFAHVRKCTAMGLEDGILAARTAFRHAWFDQENCEVGLKGLRKYRREAQVDDVSLKAKPVHDWASHYADAFRYVAISWKSEAPEVVEEEVVEADDYGIEDYDDDYDSWKVA